MLAQKTRMVLPSQDKESVGQDPQIEPYIDVSQEKAIEELEEISVKRNTK